MNLAVVDDVLSELRQLEQQLAGYLSEKHINYKIFTYSNGEDFLSAYRPGQFDAVFLDNLMDGINGMETARCLRGYDSQIPIIFITNQECFALEGYTVQAMDYILKPVTVERLAVAMDRLSSRFGSQRYIEIRENRLERRLLLDEIQYVRSVGHFLEIHTDSQILKPYMTLESLLTLLSQLGEYGSPARGLRFQNCCRGYVINFDHVSSLGPRDFFLSGGGIIPVSRSKYKEMQAAYATYLFAKTRNGC